MSIGGAGTCERCNGTHIVLNDAGEPDDCPVCNNGVVPTEGSKRMKLTKPQAKALAWVYEGKGAWRGNAGRLNAALNSLRLYHPELIEDERGSIGPRGGWRVQWRITPAGIAFYERGMQG